MAAIGRNMQFFPLLINTIIQPYIYSCVFDWIYLTVQFKHTTGDGTPQNHNSTSSRQQKVKHGVPQVSVLGTLFFYINDLPKITTKNAKFTLYADDTSIRVTNSSCKDFKINTNKVFLDIREWFKASLLSLNFKKLITFSLGQKIVIKLISYTQFLGLINDETSWKNHIDQFMPNLSSACSSVGTVKAVMTQTTLRMLYLSYVQFVMTHGINICGNLPYNIHIFMLKKKNNQNYYEFKKQIILKGTV